MKIHTIYAMFPDESDATSFYRGKGPLGVLKKQVGYLSLNTSDRCNWATLAPIDLFFCQRPFTPNHVKLCELVKRQKIPIWIDLDDWLFGVPESNPAHDIYGREEIQKCVATTLAMADIVSVSTERLRELLLPINPNIVVIPNAFNDMWFDVNDPKRIDRDPNHKLITWRGSDTHRDDLNSVYKPIGELINEFPDWSWCFLGSDPWFRAFVPSKQVKHYKAIDVFEYHDFMRKVKPAIHISPLVEHDFNLCKSNIGWIESSYAGAVCVGPNFGEWHRPGVLNYRDAKHFYEIVYDQIKNGVDTDKQRQSWEWISENLRLTKVNEKRLEIIKTLCQ